MSNVFCNNEFNNLKSNLNVFSYVIHAEFSILLVSGNFQSSMTIIDIQFSVHTVINEEFLCRMYEKKKPLTESGVFQRT